MFEEELPPRRRRVSLKIIFLIPIIGGLLFFFSLFARVFDPLWNPFRPSPPQVLKKVFERGGTIKSYQAEYRVTRKTKIGDTEVHTVIKGHWLFDHSNPQGSNVKLSAQMEVDGKTIFQFDGRKINNNYYVNFPKLLPEFSNLLSPKDGGDLSILGTDLSLLENSWWTIDEDGLWRILSSVVKILGIEISSKELSQKIKALNERLTKKLEEIYLSPEFFLIEKEFPDEKYKGKGLYHYKGRVKKEERKKVFDTIVKELLEEFKVELLDARKGLSLELIKNFTDLEDKLEVAESDLEIEMWIGKKDYYVYKLKAKESFSLPIIPLTTMKVDEEDEVIIKDLNLPQKIEPPSHAISLNEVIDRFEQLAQMIKSTQELIELENEMSKINGEISHLLNTPNYNAICSKISLDKKRFKIKNIECLASKTSYCATVESELLDQAKLCIDSELFYPTNIKKELHCVGKGTTINPYQCPLSLSQPMLRIWPLLEGSLLESTLFMRKLK